jgi:hypothetical protein
MMQFCEESHVLSDVNLDLEKEGQLLLQTFQFKAKLSVLFCIVSLYRWFINFNVNCSKLQLFICLLFVGINGDADIPHVIPRHILYNSIQVK